MSNCWRSNLRRGANDDGNDVDRTFIMLRAAGLAQPEWMAAKADEGGAAEEYPEIFRAATSRSPTPAAAIPAAQNCGTR